MSVGGIGNHFNHAAQQAMQQSAERVSTGQRINTAADDAAGHAISEGLSREISGFTQSTRNVNDAISMTQTADGMLNTMSDGIQRIRELSLQASNGTLSSSDRKTLNAEAQQIKDEITRTVEEGSFNGNKLFNGDNDISIQAGPNPGDQTALRTNDLMAVLEDSGFNNIDLSSAEGAQQAIDASDALQSNIDSERSNLGALSNRFESTLNTLSNSEVSASETRSRIQDADLAKEISAMAQEEIKRDVSITLQAQANQDRKSVLNLLEGFG